MPQEEKREPVFPRSIWDYDAMNAKANHYQHLTLLLDNIGGALAWLLSVHLAQLIGLIDSTHFYQHAALLLLILPMQFWSFRSNANTQLSFKSQAIYLAKSLGLVVMSLIVLIFITELYFINRFVVFGYALLAFTGLMAAKCFLYYWYFHGRKEKLENYTKVLIVGSGPRAQMVADKIQRAGDWGTEVIGYVDPYPDQSPNLSRQNGNGHAVDVPQMTIQHIEDVQLILSDNVVDEVIIALPRRFLSDVEPLVKICEAEGICIKLVADLFDMTVARTDLVDLDGLPVVEFHPVAQNMDMLIVKRIFDLVLTMAASPILLPLFVLIGIAIKLDSRGPVFFTQVRVGLNKRHFRMFKFRSMYEDAEQRLAEIEHLNEAQGPNFKIANDPRVTRLGHFLRRSSLDELPQLINVFLGDMSLVGPRPMSIRDVNLFDKSAQRRRFSVRPGCTCTWQISGRSNLSFDEWLELDLAYIDNWKFFEDIKILIKTVPSVVKGSGAM